MATTRQEVIADVTAFVGRKYGGDWKKAFDAEDEDGDGRLSTVELTTILAKAGVGVLLTRWAIALEVIQAVDTDGDGYISWPEFQTIAGLK